MMNEKEMRGRISSVACRCSQVSNVYMDNYNETDKGIYLMHLIANNRYVFGKTIKSLKTKQM